MGRQGSPGSAKKCPKWCQRSPLKGVQSGSKVVPKVPKVPKQSKNKPKKRGKTRRHSVMFFNAFRSGICRQSKQIEQHSVIGETCPEGLSSKVLYVLFLFICTCHDHIHVKVCATWLTNATTACQGDVPTQANTHCTWML